mmetsp:Transcript_132443/g.229742  ORF Transcript_132443/g.229742 Transcript_132443/m.229742 type:complete len:88 (+) Transcript_132443:711-974(+)
MFLFLPQLLSRIATPCSFVSFVFSSGKSSLFPGNSIKRDIVTVFFLWAPTTSMSIIKRHNSIDVTAFLCGFVWGLPIGKDQTCLHTF